MNDFKTSLQAPYLYVQDPYSVLSTEKTEAQNTQSAALRNIIRAYHSSSVEEFCSSQIWDADFFNLGNVRLFQELLPEQKDKIIAKCCRSILKEIQLIELAGTSYAAKMALLAETVEQRELYSLFSGDEARHLQMISRFIDRPCVEDIVGNSFGNFLGNLIQNEGKDVLIFLIQVILEGWGIHYYSHLVKNSKVESLSTCLKLIISDEGKHHGSGLLLFDESTIGLENEQRIGQLMLQFMMMVKAGPVGVVCALAEQLQSVGIEEVTAILEEMNFLSKMSKDVEQIKNLILKAGANRLHSYLEKMQAFCLPTTQQCAQQIVAFL
jgi:hypothetical protein